MSQILPKHIGQQRILVVDDNEATRYATGRVLRAAGFTVEEAATAGSALAIAESGVGLVVLDINLPDGDGFEVCRQLRARSDTAYLPIVHLSATFMQPTDMAQGLAAGGDSYLVHPVEPAVLIATVRALLFAREADVLRRATDARLRTVFELASSGIALLDQELTFTDVNPHFCKVTNRPRSELIGAGLADLLMGGLEQLREQLAEKGRWEGVLAVRRGDGATAQVEFRLVSEAGPGGVRIAIATDITDQLRAQEERERLLASERAARAEAERSNQLKDEFLATLSHELRNPLNSIVGWARVLRRSGEVSNTVERGLEAIERNSRVQAHLIEDLLDFAGIRFGKMHLEFAVVDPRAPVRAALEVVTEQVHAKGVRLHAQLQEEALHVWADEARLQQVIWNLLSNANKFTPTGGEIIVSGRGDGDSYEVTVSDTGAGISAEFLPHIFERFSQQDSSTRKSFHGLGIGLTIVKHLIEMHHGSIAAESGGTGRGATFRVRLPLTDQRTPAKLPGRARALEGLHVLVVDDNADALALIARILADAGARLTQARSADEALACIGQELPQVLVSDIGMAEQDGYQLLRTVRALGYDPERLPAVALTAFSRMQDRDDAIDAGFQAHLPKPVNAESLIAAIIRLARQPVRP